MNCVMTMPERRATIFNIQKYSVYDGPGIRTLVFFKGCPLRCKWCANPEGFVRMPQVMFRRDICVNCGKCVSVCPRKVHRFSSETLRHEIDRSAACDGCKKCAENCPTRAIEIMGEEKTVSELLEIIQEDRTFYEVSGGGVTLGGGEVTAQPAAALSLLQACKREGIHTAVETCGYAPKEELLGIAEFVDLFLFDIKQIDTEKHKKWTGVQNERILDNLETLLRARRHVKIRMPLLRDVNSGWEDIERVIQFLMPYKTQRYFCGIDLLPYHKMGVTKYQQLDLEYSLEADPSLSEEDLDRIEGQFRQSGFDVKVIRH